MKAKNIILTVVTILWGVSCEKKQSQQLYPIAEQHKVYDSVYVYDNKDTQDSKLLYKYYYQYDEFGNQIGGIEDRYKFSRCFDTNGNILEYISYRNEQLSGERKEWAAVEKYKYMYNSKNQTIRMELYTPEGESQWKLAASSEYTYSEDGLIRYGNDMTFSQGDTIWHKSIVKMNTKGYPIEISDSLLQIGTQLWTPMQQINYEYKYDGYGNITYSKEDKNMYSSGSYKEMIENTYAYEYDQDGDIAARNQINYSLITIGSVIDKEEWYTRRYVYYYSIH